MWLCILKPCTGSWGLQGHPEGSRDAVLTELLVLPLPQGCSHEVQHCQSTLLPAGHSPKDTSPRAARSPAFICTGVQCSLHV